MYLLFSDPNAKPVMRIESLNVAISLSLNCGYGILHESEYRRPSRGAKSLRGREPEVVNLNLEGQRCSNCHKAAKGRHKHLTARHSLKGTHLLCDDCMAENEEPVYQD